MLALPLGGHAAGDLLVSQVRPQALYLGATADSPAHAPARLLEESLPVVTSRRMLSLFPIDVCVEHLACVQISEIRGIAENRPKCTFFAEFAKNIIKTF